MNNPIFNGNVRAIFKRELYSYFQTPVAYVFIIIFLFLTGIFSFYLGAFYERGQARPRAFLRFSSLVVPVSDTGCRNAPVVRGTQDGHH